jgi:hypothetical protein
VPARVLGSFSTSAGGGETGAGAWTNGGRGGIVGFVLPFWSGRWLGFVSRFRFAGPILTGLGGQGVAAEQAQLA